MVEPSEMVSAGLKEMLAAQHRFEVVAAMPDASHLAERLLSLKPDIVMLNPSALDPSTRLSPRSSHPSLADTALVAVVYAHFREEVLRHYDEVVSIFDDAQHVARKLLSAVERQGGQVDTSQQYDLSDREKEILVSVARGMMNKEIADQHHISIHTVITHRKNITRKTGIKTVAGLTIYAILNGLVDMTEIE